MEILVLLVAQRLLVPLPLQQAIQAQQELVFQIADFPADWATVQLEQVLPVVLLLQQPQVHQVEQLFLI
jgi:hypothetical protein